jgi:hypothetical protein
MTAPRCLDCGAELRTEREARAEMCATCEQLEEAPECAPDCASRVPFGECTCGAWDVRDAIEESKANQ